MKRLIVAMVATLVAVAVVGSAAYAGQATTGNGGPSGAHYNLNIIGVPKDKTADMSGDNGHRIFVPLWGNTTIDLAQGDFKVLDANGTDGPAAFQLPDPYVGDGDATVYSVFARALGKPGGSSKTTTCFTDDTGTYCSVYSMVLVRDSKGGKSSFTNVSKELLFVYQDVDGDGAIERVALFDDAEADYFWQYDNSGLKLAQLRFYEVPSNCPAADAEAAAECVLAQ